MLVELGSLSISIERDPFRLTLCRANEICLRCTAHALAVTGMTRAETSLRIHFNQQSLLISWNASPDTLHLQADPPGQDFSLSFELPGHWYGHGELVHQLYPLERMMLPESTFQTYDNGPDGQSCKLTPAWYSSKGMLILAHSPVMVGFNQPPAGSPRHDWSLGAEKGPFAERPLADPGQTGDGLLTLRGPDLNITIHMETDALAAYKKLIEITGHPAHTPPDDLFGKPTWTTWARYKTAITQQLVLDFARQIIEHDYPCNVLEIDDRWQTHYGDISFDPARFPDPRGMIEQLHALGFKVTAWVIPFLDPASHAFEEGQRLGYLLRETDGQTACLTTWWQGRGALLDVSNPAALNWFRERLQDLQRETGLDGYKFDAGEAAFFPPQAHSAEPMLPNDYTHRYIEFIAQHFSLTEARSAWFNQRAPIFFRQWDKWSTWGLDNGLHSVLTGILALGLTGYPFILPDMVGGNAYDNNADAELMIRWTQLNALLPAMQFSLAPWDYGEECTRICRRYAALHLEFTPRILELASEAAQNGTPLIRPIWWLAQHNETALTCDDEFLLGNDILVAPILQPGATARDIYLPPGQWRDYWVSPGSSTGWNGQVFEGDTQLSAYPAGLDVLPIFVRS
jgi:alpha-glucosidase (family GH31 glycosyl hydrolase)